MRTNGGLISPSVGPMIIRRNENELFSGERCILYSNGTEGPNQSMGNTKSENDYKIVRLITIYVTFKKKKYNVDHFQD